jgi:preprotein translocase subunit YajC
MTNSFALFLLQAQGGAGSFLFSLLPMLLIFGLFYFLILGPQRKRQQQMQEMLEALKVGDQVVTSGGLTGVITQFFDDRRYVQLRICESPAVRVKILRSAVAERITDLSEAKK